MGSFNINGFYSHLPIEYGDEIGVIVCVQVKDPHINLAVEPTVNLYPIMAPVYGKYGDSFTIYDIDKDSYTAELFKQHTGFSIRQFIDSNARNGNVSVSTPDNHNRIDDIPNYQKIISHLIADEYDTQSIISEDKLSEMDSSAREQYESIIKHFENLNRNRLETTYCPIYEHKHMLEALIESGKKMHIHEDFRGNIVDISKDYDDVTKFISIIKNEKSNLFTSSVFDVDDELNIFDCNTAFMHFNRYLKNENNSFDLYRLVFDANTAFMRFNRHIRQDLKNENNSFVLYRLAENIDYVRLKPEFIDAVYLDTGLNHMGGVYQVCRYGYQEYCLENFMNLHNAMNNILEKKQH